MKYQLYAHDSNITVNADSKTLAGAKREASAWMSFGGGSVSVIANGEMVGTRTFWQAGNCFGWGKWVQVTR